MGYNVLSGSTSVTSVVTSGSFIGDGSQLENVEQFPLQNASAARIPFYKTIDGELGLNASSTFTFDASSNSLNVPGLTSSVGIKLLNPVSGALAGDGSYLGIDSNGNLIVTSSASGQGPTNSLQFHAGGGLLTGSSSITYENGILNISGSGSSGEAAAITGSLLPGATNTYDLGSPDKQWRSLYVSSSTVYFGGESLSVDNGSLKFGSGSASKGFHVGHLHLLNKGIVMDRGFVFNIGAYQTKFNGGIAYMRVVKIADYQMQEFDYLIGVATDHPSITGSLTMTLPSASVCEPGQNFVIKDEGGNANNRNIIIKATDSDTIDGLSSVILESPFSSINLYTNGIGKFFIH